MARMVWTTGARHSHVHATKDCLGMRTAAHRNNTELVEVPLAQVLWATPCKRCWPEAPRLRVWHPICRTCRQSRPLPCPHNGAVLVNQPRRGQWTGKFGDSEYDPTSVTYVHRWVWPENAYRYTLVNTGQAA
jgi:hypothetical protein